VPSIPELKSIKETIIEDPKDMKREEVAVDPKEY